MLARRLLLRPARLFTTSGLGRGRCLSTADVDAPNDPPPTTLPSHARTIVVGGGVIGSSVAYHLTQHAGYEDVLLLEQNAFTSGTTWHAAGLIGLTRNTEAETKLSLAGMELAKRLEAETGQSPGYKQCGSVNVARTPERMTVFKRQLAKAKTFGITGHLLTPEECGQQWGRGQLLETSDLVGGVWWPMDGSGSPTDLTMAMLKGARSRGAVTRERVRVTDFVVHNVNGRRTAKGVVTADGQTVTCDTVVLCGGQWSRQMGASAGVNVPLHSAEHFYVITDPILPGVTPDLPVLRDPDGLIYVREWSSGLCVGGFELNAKPAFTTPSGVPHDWEFGLFDDDWTQFWPLYEAGIERIPKLETVGVRNMVNGPESFTCDNGYLLGPSPDVDSFFVCAGMNSSGIASSGGAGKALAEWVVNGEPTQDLWAVDIRRPTQQHYSQPWPKLELESCRGLRLSPLNSRLTEAGAVYGQSFGWERANVFDHSLVGKRNETFDHPPWLKASREEHLNTRSHVSLFDVSSFSKFSIQGRDAAALLNAICANNMDVQPGTVVYTSMLNSRGGFETDCTITRMDDETFSMVSPTAQATRDAAWIQSAITRQRAAGEMDCVTITDVTSGSAVLSVQGPNSRALLQATTDADLSDTAFPPYTAQWIGIGYAQAHARRVSYVGTLGWELVVPVESAHVAFDTLVAADKQLGTGLKLGGYYVQDGLRIEAGRRAWGHELDPDVTPWEAGVGFAVDLKSGKEFVGRRALVEQKDAGLSRRLVQLALVDPKDAAEVMVWGGESVQVDGAAVTSATSAAYGHSVGGPVLMAYLPHPDKPAGARFPNNAAIRDYVSDLNARSAVSVDVSGRLCAATVSLKPLV